MTAPIVPSVPLDLAPPESGTRLRVGRAVAAVGIVVGAMALAVVLKNSRPKAPRKDVPVQRVGVRVVNIGAQDLAPRIEGLARARAHRRVSIASDVTGRVIAISLALEDGAHIASGTVVVQIDPVDAQARLAQAQALEDSARAEVSRLEGSEQFLARRIDLSAATLELERAELKRVQGLSDRGINSPRDLDQARRAVLRTEDQLVGLRQLETLLVPQLAAAEARVREQVARRTLAELELQRTTIRAPFSGQVANVKVEKHQRVAPGQVLFELWDTSTVEVPVVLSVADAALLAEDLRPEGLGRVEVSYENRGQVHRWKGALERLEPVDPDTQTLGAVVTVRNELGQGFPLSPGLFCHVTLEAPTRKIPLALPIDALQEGSRVYVCLDGHLAVVRVVTGLRIGGWVHVERGLKAGDQVIVSPLERAIEGTPLTVLDAVEPDESKP
jgi:RND family efflux transporter MFP subunit